MKFEIYCDESGLEALSKKEAHLFSSIGGICMPANYREVFKESIKSIKIKYSVLGELKWNKVSPAYLDLYIGNASESRSNSKERMGRSKKGVL